MCIRDRLKTAKAVFDGYSTKKDADFVEERRFKVSQTKDDTAPVSYTHLDVYKRQHQSRAGQHRSRHYRHPDGHLRPHAGQAPVGAG